MTERNEPETEPALDPADQLPDDVAHLHGVAFFLAEHLKPGEGGEAFAPLEEDVLLEVAGFLHHLTESEEDTTEELLHAVHTIASFVAGNKGDSPKLAEQVRELLELPFVVEAIKTWSTAADPEQVKKISEKFGAFSDIDGSKRAPKVGEEKPEGAVDLNALNFPKRL